MIDIAVLNESTLISDAQIAPIVAACQEDLGRNGALWALDTMTLHQIPKGDPAPPGMRQLLWLDDSDQADALGYHELTSEGMPLGKTFVRTTQVYGQAPSRVFSHELWEFLVDPDLNRYAPRGRDGREYAIEVGDLLSLDQQGRTGLGGVLLSGIALPAAYYPGYGSRYDIGGVLSAGLPNVAPAQGAYLMWRGGAGWAPGAASAPFSIQTPPTADPNEFMHMQAQHGSRRHRRVIGAANWRRSTVPGAAA